jgi:hypothetical protein
VEQGDYRQSPGVNFNKSVAIDSHGTKPLAVTFPSGQLAVDADRIAASSELAGRSDNPVGLGLRDSARKMNCDVDEQTCGSKHWR